MRVCTLQDLSALVALEATCFPRDPWSKTALASHLSDGTGYAILYEEEGEPLGYLLARVIPPEAELYRIATLPACRGRGIGDKLLSYFQDNLTVASCDALFLEVRESNVPARRLYEKHGMRMYARRKNYYQNPKEDAVLYTKP